MIDLSSVVNSATLLSVAGSLFYKGYTDIREYNKKKVLDYAVGLIEEGISYLEEKNKWLKREAAVNAGKALQKQPVEVTKDQNSVDKFLQSAMVPVRQIAHDNAREYIKASVEKLTDKKLKKAMDKIMSSTIDLAIDMRISGAKMGIQESIRPLLYRSM